MTTMHWVTIDGPAASGKSTLGRAVARRLGWPCIDTGILYRAVAWLVCHDQINPDDAEACATLARTAELRFLSLSHHGQHPSFVVMVRGKDVSELLSTPFFNTYAPLIASHHQVRSALTARFRELATQQSMVMVGRDCGRIILPEADLKIYLTARDEQRALRRWKEVYNISQQNGVLPPSLEQVQADLLQRDERDQSQLLPAIDANVIETSEMDEAQVYEIVISLLIVQGLVR